MQRRRDSQCWYAFRYAKAAAKEYEVAVQYMERAIAVSEALAKRYPETALVRQEIAYLYGQLASLRAFLQTSATCNSRRTHSS